MSMLIVHMLKVVEVNKQEAKLISETFRTVYLVREHRKQMACVLQASAVVVDAEFLDALDSTGILYGDGGVIGQGPQQHLVAGVHLHIDVHHLDDAQNFASRPHR